MKPDPFLMIPGPTPIPQPILEVLARPPIGHRSQEFKSILTNVYSDLQWIFQTKQPVLLYTASGTGAMEAALVNTLNPGDDILVLACGVFSARWAEIGKALGLNVHLQEIPMGQANDPEDLAQFFKSGSGKQIKAVCMIHSETSTGVLNPIQKLTEIIHQHSDALVIVDTVTSLGASPFYFDDWQVDIAVSGSQKGFMLPPGLSFLAVSEKAMKAHQNCKNPGYYFNFAKSVKSIEASQTAYTPALGLIRGLEKALEMMKNEGLDAMLARHSLNQQMTRQAIRSMGLELFVPEDSLASHAATSVLPPSGITVDAIRAGMREDFNITIANGQKDLTGKIFRIGHLGAIFPREILMGISALEAVLHQLQYDKTPLGTGVSGAQEVWIQHD